MRNANAVVWDLDNTLYPFNTDYLGKITSLYAEYLAQSYSLPFEDAEELRAKAFAHVGLEVFAFDDLDPEHYYHWVFDRLINHLDWLTPNKQVNNLFTKIDVPQYVLSHSRTDYAVDVVRRLGLDQHIPAQNIFGLDTVGIHPTSLKTHEKPYIWLQKRLGVPYRDIVVVEDSIKNLVAAKGLGMYTIHIGQRPKEATPYIDESHPDLPALLKSV